MAGGTGPFRHYQLTLTGSVQSLKAAVPAPLADDAFEGNPTCAWIDLQADDGNSSAIYVGGDTNLGASTHGVRIPAPTSGVPDPPYRIDGDCTLAPIYVIGTNNEKLNVFVRIA